MALEGILGGLETLLGLEPDETELVLDIVDHDGLIITALVSSLLSGRVGTSELKVLVLLLEVLAAVSLPEDGAVLGRGDLEGVRENLVSGDDILQPWSVFDHLFPSSNCEFRLENNCRHWVYAYLVDDHGGG